ncbi:hypothetical protein CP965_03795 [Halarcobacter mediterraneus]|uniref:DNA2/NAM7 helicase-like C-terminal domain-containing protein n=3 Tax=Arcobacteraceae TaxID=2808963 RepID=A0A4Q1AXR9_9BACT|nr:hypothetical protein CP965_03795 [Halarcobacter mediterraneus]
MKSFIKELFSQMSLSSISSEEILNYYYQCIVESSLQGLKFPISDVKVEKVLSKINLFYINHQEEDKKQYIDNLNMIRKHIQNIKPEKRKDYRLIYFPFLHKFTQYSSLNRNDKYITSPIYFIFDIDDKTQDKLDELVSITIDNSSNEAVFKNGQIVFNTLYASRDIYSMDFEEIDTLRELLDDEEFNVKYPIKDFEFFKSLLIEYLKNCKSELKLEINPNEEYSELLKKFHKGLMSFNRKNDTLENFEFKSGILLADSEAILDADIMLRGIRYSYKKSIIPFIEENSKKEHKFNRIFFNHENRLLDKSKSFNKSNNFNSLNLSVDNVNKLQQRHYGSFSKNFPLTKSQRLAMCAVVSNMDIVPVNGPPGTGKTALLRSIFSNYIVKNAYKAANSYLKNKKNPFKLIDTGKPILGTSSVRQAINNLISGISEGFQDSSKIDIRFTRWLELSNKKYNKVDLIDKFVVVPQIRNSEEKYKDDILFTSLESIFQYIHSLDYVDFEKKYINSFIESYKKILPKDFKEEKITIEYCISFLINFMETAKKRIQKSISENKNMDFETYEKLDKFERFEFFFASLHLLEAFFILNIKKINKMNITNESSCPICNSSLIIENKIECKNCSFEVEKNREFNKLKNEFTIDDLNLLLKDSLVIEDIRYGLRYNENNKKYQISILENEFNSLDNIFIITPLFPMLCVTMHSFYGAFKDKKNDELRKDFFDLTLTDESGMILPHIAMPIIYSSKKMIVVGDEKQIEPIAPFDKSIDNIIYEKQKLKIGYSQFIDSYSVLNQNLIKLINKSTYIKTFEMKEYEKNSLWLKEHFRCKDEIIEYCNDIVYNGILVPKVREVNSQLFLDDAKDEYPSIKIFNLESEVYKNRSELEASAIADFLFHNIEKLTQLYNAWKHYTKKDNETYDSIESKDFYRKIGIVTPFNNQKYLIKKSLSKEFNLNKILIGTVHAFQGSEKEIIIFSPTIGKDCSFEHFTNKDDGNMMNVAVSRAKSAFWVFGSVEGMKKAGRYTEVLEKYIELKQDYEFYNKSNQIVSNIRETAKTFRTSNKYIFKNFRNKDLTLEEAEKILNGETVKVQRVSKTGNLYEINVYSDGNGKLNSSFD